MYKDALDEYILHMAFLELYANNTYEEIQALLDVLIDDVLKTMPVKGIRTKQKLQQSISVLSVLLEQFERKTEQKIELLVDTAYEKIVEWLPVLVIAAGKKNFSIPKAVKNKITMASLNGKDSLKDYPKNLSRKIETALKSQFNSAYLFASTTEITEENISEITPAIKRGIESDVSTIIPSVARTIEILSYKTNNINELLWIATLDGSTCLVCANLSGRKFKITEAPVAPVHNRCRCITVPYVKGIESPSFSEWLERQKEDVQKQVLGAARYKMWKQGAALDRFVSKNRVIPLSEL